MTGRDLRVFPEWVEHRKNVVARSIAVHRKAKPEDRTPRHERSFLGFRVRQAHRSARRVDHNNI